MTPGERLAIAAHLHVLLRRKTGRVTDPEWMAANVEYATEIVRFTRGKAKEDGHTDLAIWADKLEAAMADPVKAPRQPLAQVLRERAAASAPAPLAAWSESLRPAAPAQAPVPAQASAPAPADFAESAFTESGFAESTFVDELGQVVRRRRDPNAPRYVGGLR